MPENTPENEPHSTVRKRNVMLILAAAAIIAGLCHAYRTYVDSATPAPAEETPAAEAPAES